MNKKLISLFMAAVTAVSLSVSVFAASASHSELDVDTNLGIPKINMKWPTTAGVVFNPYKMKVKYDLPSAANGTDSVTVDNADGDDSTVISPELVFTNEGESDVSVKVTASVTAAALNDGGDTHLTSDNQTVSEKIKFASAPIRQPSYDSEGNFDPGETENVVLLYLEVGHTDDYVNWTYADSYDQSNASQMLLSNTETSKKLFTVSKKNGDNTNVAHLKICGDMAIAPTIGWDQIALTETIDVKLVFDASPVAPLPEVSKVTAS